MDNAIYVGLSRQMTLQRAMDVTANNIANIDTAGFKVETLAIKEDQETPLSAPATQPISYVLDNGLTRNFGQGALESTGNPLDVAIEGAGFFTVQTPDGPRYTRDGRFTLDANGVITDKHGSPVLDQSGAPISLDAKNGAPTIGKDGTVSQTSASGQALQVGKLGVASFSDRTGLTKVGDNQYAAPDGVTPQTDKNTRLQQGMVEKSNVQAVSEVVRLISITRAYENVAQMLSAAADLSESAVTRLGKAA
jgi:flagellar basal-body rod protein FlgF